MKYFSNLLLLFVFLSVSIMIQAQTPVRPYNQWEATQFIAVNGYQPEDYVMPDEIEKPLPIAAKSEVHAWLRQNYPEADFTDPNWPVSVMFWLFLCSPCMRDRFMDWLRRCIQTGCIITWYLLY